MRIVGEIPHPVYKISILKHMGKFTLKIEANATEQSYKIRESESIQSPADIEKLVNNNFLSKVDKVFLDMGDNLMNLVTDSPDSDLPMIEGII